MRARRLFSYLIAHFLMSLSSISAQTGPIDIERYVSQSKVEIPESCSSLVFTNTHVDFTPFSRPTSICKNLNMSLSETCNIVVVIGVGDDQEFAPYEKFIQDYFFQIPLVILFLKKNIAEFSNVKSLPGKKIWRKDVTIVSADGSILQLENNCGYEDPICFLREASLNVGYNHMPPYLYVRNWSEYEGNRRQYPIFYLNASMNDKQLGIIHGFEGQLLRHLVTEYLMKFTMIAPKDMKYGNNEHGVWSGKFGYLERDEIDLIIGIVPGNRERAQIGKYLSALCNVRFSMITKQPELQVGWLAPFLVLSPMIWYILLGCICTIAIFACGANKLHNCIIKDRSDFHMKHLPRIKCVIAYCVQLIQALIKQPLTNSTQGPVVFVFLSWMILSLIIGSIYNSNLTATLSVPQREKAIENMEDVWNERKILTIGPATTVDLYIRTTKDRYTQLVRKELIRYAVNLTYRTTAYFYNPNIVGLTEDLQFYFKVLSGTDGIGHRKLSEIHISKPIMEIFGSWMVSKDLIFGPAINSAILRALEMGLLKKWASDPLKLDDNSYIFIDTEKLLSFAHNEKSDAKRLAIDNQDLALKLMHLKGIFLLWIVGVSLSIFTFLFELAVKAMDKQNRRFPFQYVQ